ncbi:MAG TPA: hypothetical protein VN761_01585 [Candidatus Polarisedimenticolia bacterium]|nr:hypothetical protein [Candidatus Polarisedimenticolia bacterium]
MQIRSLICGLVLIGVAFCSRGADQAAKVFPTPAEVFQGRTFAGELARDIFFLRAIHDRYPEHWPELLEANINERDYIQSPAKMLRFIQELGQAMRDSDDPAAITNLAKVTSDKRFFTNIDAYHPDILDAATLALIQLGPNGRKALAASFSESHYCEDSGSLVELAKTIGERRPADPVLAKALAATAFDFSTTNGGIFPICTTEAVKNLLLLPAGAAEVRTHLNTNEFFGNPVRFEAVIDGVKAVQASDLKTNLTAMDAEVKAKMAELKNHPGDYRDALHDLGDAIRDALEAFTVEKAIKQ